MVIDLCGEHTSMRRRSVDSTSSFSKETEEDQAAGRAGC